MREIKFRAWDEVEKQMVQKPVVSSFDWTKGSQTGSHKTLMQFTGVLDSDYKEIYEGDIVKYGKTGIHEIEWDEKKARWTWSGFALTPNQLKNLTVIGNIHENPELFESRLDVGRTVCALLSNERRGVSYGGA